MSISHRSIARRVLTHPVHFLSFGFGAGLAPRMPGTAGTVVGVAFFWGLRPLGAIGYALATAVMGLAGIWLCGASARGLGVHDHPGIVWDEIVGYLITMLPVVCLPFHGPAWVWVLAGFLLFRVLDITKPGPIRWLDRHVDGGVGIMLDDVLAGMTAAAFLALLWRVGGA